MEEEGDMGSERHGESSETAKVRDALALVQEAQEDRWDR